MRCLSHSQLLACAVVTLFTCSLSDSYASKKPAIPVLAALDNKALAQKTGKTIAVEGVVTSVGKGSKDGVRFLDFSQSKITGFVAAVFPVAYPKMDALKNYLGKTIRVTGELEKYKKRTQIKILKASQIKVLPTPAPRPTPAKKKS